MPGHSGGGIMAARLKRAERIIELLNAFGQARIKKLDPTAMWVPTQDAGYLMGEDGLELEALLLGKTLTEARRLAKTAISRGG